VYNRLSFGFVCGVLGLVDMVFTLLLGILRCFDSFGNLCFCVFWGLVRLCVFCWYFGVLGFLGCFSAFLLIFGVFSRILVFCGDFGTFGVF